MAIATRSPQTGQRRIWKAPASKARWLWLGVALVLYGGILAVYFYAIKTQPFPGPFNDPLRSFGIIAFLLVLTTASYSLRRRFARNLPGKAQDWLWMHTWLGVTAILVALLHENFTHILRNYCANASCLTTAYGGTSALIALFVLVLSGIVGRLLDTWQARRIAQDASANGAGIARAIDERLLELEYTIERLCAGKSEAFQGYCLQSITSPAVQQSVPAIDRREREDFERAQATLAAYAALARSQRSQQQARRIFRAWRAVHMILAALALLIILIHSIMELLVNVFHLIPSV